MIEQEIKNWQTAAKVCRDQLAKNEITPGWRAFLSTYETLVEAQRQLAIYEEIVTSVDGTLDEMLDILELDVTEKEPI